MKFPDIDDDYLEWLRTQERELRRRLASVHAAIDAYTNGQARPADNTDAVMALVLIDGFRRGWRFVLQSWKQYVSVLFGGVAVLVAALVIVMVAVAFSKHG